jgi:hypothetical protein
MIRTAVPDGIELQPFKGGGLGELKSSTMLITLSGAAA